METASKCVVLCCAVLSRRLGTQGLYGCVAAAHLRWSGRKSGMHLRTLLIRWIQPLRCSHADWLGHSRWGGGTEWGGVRAQEGVGWCRLITFHNSRPSRVVAVCMSSKAACAVSWSPAGSSPTAHLLPEQPLAATQPAAGTLQVLCCMLPPCSCGCGNSMIMSA